MSRDRDLKRTASDTKEKGSFKRVPVLNDRNNAAKEEKGMDSNDSLNRKNGNRKSGRPSGFSGKRGTNTKNRGGGEALQR